MPLKRKRGGGSGGAFATEEIFNANVDFQVSNTFQAVPGVTIEAGAWYLINPGTTGIASSSPSGKWLNVYGDQILGLAPAAAGDVTLQGTQLHLDYVGGGVLPGTGNYAVGRTANNGLLMSSESRTEDALPLRIHKIIQTTPVAMQATPSQTAIYGRPGLTMATLDDPLTRVGGSGSARDVAATNNLYNMIAPANQAQDFDIMEPGLLLRIDNRIHGPDGVLEFARATPPDADHPVQVGGADSYFEGVYFRPATEAPVEIGINPEFVSNFAANNQNKGLTLSLNKVMAGTDDIPLWVINENYFGTGADAESRENAHIVQPVGKVLQSAAQAADRPWHYLKLEGRGLDLDADATGSNSSHDFIHTANYSMTARQI